MKRVVTLAAALALLFVLSSISAFAGPSDPCPAVGDNLANTCNILITIAADGSITTSNGAATQPYDNVVKGGAGEDVTVGVINDSSSTVTSLTITGAPTGGDAGPFDFDESTAADGVCDPSLGVTPSNCPKGLTIGNAFPFGPTGYESSLNVQFSNFASKTTGTVNFKNGILGPGNSTWFGLEAPAGLNLKVTPAPEPGSVLLFASGLLGLGGVLRRRLGL